MKRFLKTFNLILAALFIGALLSPTKSHAQACVDMLEYFNPSGQGSANLINNGERFYNVQSTVMGMPGFYIVKNATGEVYEEFAYDDQYIYHLRDTSWATGPNQNVQCEGFDAGFTMVRGNVDPNTVDITSYAPAPWIKRNMCEGDVMNSDHTIVAFKKDGQTCSRCNAPYTGHTSFAMKFNKYYPTYNVGGSIGTINDVVEVQIIEGNGSGETFLYAKQYGWIGFGRSSSISNKITATGPKVNNVKVCTLVEGGEGSIGMCEGPVDVDKTLYRGQVIGHQDPSPDGKGPWKIYASATDEKENSTDIVSSVIVNKMTIAPIVYWSTDFSTVNEKFIGSLNSANADFIDSKVASQFKMSTYEPRAPPIYLTSHIPGYVFQGGFQIPPQLEKTTAESYAAFQGRVYPSQDGQKPGKKSTIDNLNMNQAFIGCVQAAACDPAVETCLKNDRSGEECAEGDSPTECIGVGELIKFSMTDSGKMEFLEPADRQPMDKVMWDFSTSIARRPGDMVPRDRGVILGTSLEDYYAQEKEFLAKQDSDTQSYIASVVPNADNPDAEIGSSYSVENINPLNPKEAQAQEAETPYEDNQPYCQGAHILIENKTAENQYSVKVWNGQPECPQPVDWGYYIEYWVGSEATGYSQVSSCGSPSGGNIHRSYGLPIFNPNGSDEEKWGVPIETLPGCSIPVTPRELAEGKLELKVHFQITSGSAPYSDNPNCTQRPVCTCPNEEACGLTTTGERPKLDCTKCETWAPSGECATMIAEDLLEITDEPDCDNGFCQVENQAIRLVGDMSSPVKDTISISLGDWLSELIKGIFAGTAKLFNYHCEQVDSFCEEDYDPCPGGSSSGSQDCCMPGQWHEGNWQCTFGERQYLMYGYVPSRFMGKLNRFRTESDFLAFQAMYKIPGVSETYFEPMPSKHEMDFKLTLGDEEGGIQDDISGNVPPACGTNFLSSKLGSIFGLGGPNSCLDLAIGGSDTRTMYIEYTDHYSQAAQYCLSEATGSWPGYFPTRALELCEPFMASLRGGGFSRSSIPGTQISDSTIKKIEERSLEAGVPARLLAIILEIEGGGNINSCQRNSDTATGPFQITDLTILSDNSIVSPQEKIDWNLVAWPPNAAQSQYRADGRCDPDIAPVLAARVLKYKAQVDPRTGTISESDFETLKKAFRGYYGSCTPDSFTEGRWGPGIGYCDYGLHRMGLTQYCTNGLLSPSCDNEGGPTGMDISPVKEIVKNSVAEPIELSEDPSVIEAQLAADLGKLLDKYSKYASFDMDTPIDEMPIGFQKELENLKRTYEQKYSL